MNPLPAEDEDNVRRFLESLCLRNRDGFRMYRGVLRGFLSFVRARSGNMSLCEGTMVAWLEDRRQHCALHTVERIAREVDRFLDWMTMSGRIPSNPLQGLRAQYGKRTGPIARALLSADRLAALEELRPLPPFASPLGPLMRDHLALMRSLGHRYIAAEGMLRRFDQFLQRRPELNDLPLTSLVEAWRQAGTGVQHALEAQQCGRKLSKAQARLDPGVGIILGDRQLLRQVLAHHRRPYIYTEDEVAKLLATARSFPSPMSPLRPVCLYTMLVLAYCAGLRIREVVNLTLGDVNLQEGTIEIRETKFFKSRRLPLAASVVGALQTYLEERRKAGAPTAATAALFWHQQEGGRYSSRTAWSLLVEVLRLSGIKPAQGRVGPRVHDLRHAMVCNRMLSWYRQGINPQSRLAHLSTFMGHKDINSTLAYLTITPELLQLAGERFRQRAVHVLRNTEKPS
jgi:integrase/recombinase XerD